MADQPRAEDIPEDWAGITLHELGLAMHESEITEIVWQSLIGAYLDHEGWRMVAEAVFEKHGYTVEEIVRGNQ